MNGNEPKGTPPRVTPQLQRVRQPRLMSFGELALFSGGRRTADVIALGEVRCRVLTRAEVDRLGQT